MTLHTIGTLKIAKFEERIKKLEDQLEDQMESQKLDDTSDNHWREDVNELREEQDRFDRRLASVESDTDTHRFALFHSEGILHRKLGSRVAPKHFGVLMSIAIAGFITMVGSVVAANISVDAKEHSLYASLAFKASLVSAFSVVLMGLFREDRS